MDNELVPSLSDILTDSNSDESLHNQEEIDQKCETSNVDVTRDSGTKIESTDLVLDLRNFHGLRNLQNDEENYEKLSEVIEEPEDLPEVATLVEGTTLHSGKDTGIESRALQERIASLNTLIVSLRAELQREVSLWQKERQEYQMLQERNDLLVLEEATSAARAAAEAYATESPLSDALDGLQYNNCCNRTGGYGEILDVNPEQTLSELTILEYEKKLAKYQDALALAQAEKRYNMRRQLAANTYRQKLMEVERLCDEELEKIQQNANSLQPLKQMVSQWYSADRCGGDADKVASSLSITADHAYCKPPPCTFAPRKDYYRSTFGSGPSINEVNTEVNMAPEILVAKFNVEEIDTPLCRIRSGINWMDNDRDRQIMNGTDPLSVKWNSSNYSTLSMSLANP